MFFDVLDFSVFYVLFFQIYLLKPAPERNFPITFKDGEIVYPDFAYPMRPNIVPIWLSAIISFGVPAIVIALCQIRIRSFWDVNNAIFGITYSLINAAAFQVFIKWLIGGLRPHFLDVCKPDMTKINGINGVGVGFQNLFFTKDVCTGDESEINDSLESMPSGRK
uniref:Uncharacterized protein n=1 Tax=Panagrolaimus superbus TaxID=310955 RepID=A0A914YKT3_9BILA